MNHCLCSVHLKNEEPDRKEGKEPLKCVGHGGDCPCSQPEEVKTNEDTGTLQGENNP